MSLRACPNCHKPTIPVGKNACSKGNPFACPVCGARVYLRYRPLLDLSYEIFTAISAAHGVIAWLASGSPWLGICSFIGSLVIIYLISVRIWPLAVMENQISDAVLNQYQPRPPR